MNKFRVLFFLLIVSLTGFAQQKYVTTEDGYPLFEGCDTVVGKEECFKSTLLSKIEGLFKVPDDVIVQDSLEFDMLFEVTESGEFKVLFVDVEQPSVKTEMERVFKELPKVQPVMYSGRPTFSQYTVTIKYPFAKAVTPPSANNDSIATSKSGKDLTDAFANPFGKSQYDSISVKRPYENKEFDSKLNIPFHHQYYAIFDPSMNAVGTNAHTASKPFVYNEVASYYDLEKYTNSLLQERNTWFGRKFWNEHFTTIVGEDYWFSFDIVADLRVGRDTYSSTNTYNNTRAVRFQGGLGKNLNFNTVFYESQGRFASYFNEYAESMAPDGGNPAIIPGRGIAKEFGEDSYDYPVAEAYLSYSPTKFLNIQFGQGKNFIGDGYRSLLTSDAASPYPFLKLNTTFWKFKYTNTWMWLKDVRPEATEDGAYLTKYMATHYLSWNVSKRLNLGFFESVIWKDDNHRGFDVSYLNPLIFYRAMEFYAGSRSGNALIGLTGKYKINDRINVYSQFILDELSVGNITGGEKSWANKFGYQIGAKYYNAFGAKDLTLQLEYNQVRPYTYSHDEVYYNYGHNNQSMAHLWGANFKELIAIANYRYDRWFGYAKVTYGEKGLDFNSDTDNYSYGGNIYRTYNDRVGDIGINMLQGNKTSIFITELQAGYVINPVTNLRLYGNVLVRNFDPSATTETAFKQNTVWFSLGFRTDLFNWYNDF
ncbi:hypothetical protein NBRC110019_00520 [Neptunitalea chrysea]|uniref:Gliding motility protein RemB n=1 Tax=Neptunitalea chrysea TaxID=1647581 RepID=A0A9W6B5B7_9FLAO|nr:gliding motility protein RemB [Neptunitalea chrysea]GLB51013.1 hypothetical protein NBRC110019_00520 [Neptunitalea chrysea]